MTNTWPRATSSLCHLYFTMGNLWYGQKPRGHECSQSVAQCMHFTFVSSFQPILFIPIQEKSCLEARKAKLV